MYYQVRPHCLMCCITRCYEIFANIFGTELSICYFCENGKTMIKPIDKDEVNRVNDVVCRYFNISKEDLYKEGKKNKVCTNAFCHILYYLHCVKNVSIEQLSREYKRKRRILLSHIAKQKDFMRIYHTTRKESEEICGILEKKE